MELLLDDQVGIEMSNIYQYFKILYGVEQNCFFGGEGSEDMEFGANNSMFVFINLIHIM